MRVKKEYKEKPKILIFENKPAFPFNYQAIVDLEREIILHLYRAKAQTNYQVHQALLDDKVKCEYTKVRRTLEDLFALGWIAKRRAGSKTLYFLTVQTRKDLEEQIDDNGLLRPSGHEIDHIRPCTSFDLSKPEEVKKCFSPENLRWLPKKENRSKSAYWTKDGVVYFGKKRL